MKKQSHLRGGERFTEDAATQRRTLTRISGLVVEYIVAIDVTRVRFPDDAFWKHVPFSLQKLSVASGFFMASFVVQRAPR